MRTKLILAGLLLTLASLHAFAQTEPAAALTGARSFTTPAAVAAQSTYTAGLKAARVKYAAELDQAVKVALTAANLDEANAIDATRQKLATDGLPVTTAPFKTSQANEARLHYEAAVTTVQRQYGRDLQQALKGAMSAANLDEANEINGEIKALVAVLATASSPTPGPSAAPPPIGQSSQKARGLEIVRYRRHPSQASGDNYNGYVAVENLGKPVGAPHTVKSLSKWTKDKDENAVVSGFIKTDKAGAYEFRTRSDFDRNELLINGQIVCKFRDGEDKAQSIQLSAGLIPVTSIAYASRTTDTFIQWKPPGQADWSDIPNELLSH